MLNIKHTLFFNLKLTYHLKITLQIFQKFLEG